jgi:hypothetical protein
MDKECRESVDGLRTLQLPLASVYLKVPSESLLREKRDNAEKRKWAARIVDAIKAKRDRLQEIESGLRSMSNTSVPFFDIDYRTVLKMIVRNYDESMAEVPVNKEVVVLNKNIHLFERLFGFKFKEGGTIASINNQSYIDSTERGNGERTQKSESSKATTFLERQRERDEFRVFAEPSTILSDAQSCHVD